MKAGIFAPKVQEYVPPIIEITVAAVEQGFEGSYGDKGSAGGDLGWGGEFEL